MRILGLDIGGANIKAATNDGASKLVAFPMWKQCSKLADTLQQIATDEFAEPHLVAVTMTAELADCFRTKADGVEFIIEAVIAAFPDSLIRIWLTSGEFAEPDDALELPGLVAAANWHALATWSGRAVPAGPALLIDVGSTTTDLIPLLDGLPASQGLNDLERLANRELIYTGAVRTPVCAVVRTVPLGAIQIPVAAELFATALDVHLINGDIPERTGAESAEYTADGQPATIECAFNRLAHMLCCDTTELSADQLRNIAAHVARSQAAEITAAIDDRLNYLSTLPSESNLKPAILISGSGHFLAAQALAKIDADRIGQTLNLSQMYNARTTAVACAFAVARLAAERCLDDLLPMQIF